jgi:hypothetical protein
MDFAEFRRCLDDPAPPPALDMRLRALWLDANARPEAAMRAACADASAGGAWVRAYLLRKAGVEREARYWYWRAGVTPSTDPPDAEWTNLVQTFLVEIPVAASYGF